MAITYIDLVNRLRDRFNEPRLTPLTWNNTIGFDQFTKDAINYAYHDILNAEMEWPFLYQKGLLTTSPGTQFYTFTPASSQPLNADIKEIDWDSFFIQSNENVFTIQKEPHFVPNVAPYTVNIANASWTTDLGVVYTQPFQAIYDKMAIYDQSYLYDTITQAFTPVTGIPQQSQYTINNGTYIFNKSDKGRLINISYTYVTLNTTNPQQISAAYLPYIDYNEWRQRYLITDINALPQSYQKPCYVFKPQQFDRIGLTPVPDLVYNIGFEYWVDANDMVNMTDVPIIPQRFWQVIIDGAQKYCYEFREDAQLAQSADVRLKAGIYRMRIELINREDYITTGFYWRRYGFSSTSGGLSVMQAGTPTFTLNVTPLSGGLGP